MQRISKKKSNTPSQEKQSFVGSFAHIAKNIRIDYRWLVLVVIFLFHLFFRFYELEERIQFGWDQVDQAWAAKEILLDNKQRLVGMVAKLDTGIRIGPAYYYLISPFYYFFNMHPIASPVFAGVTSIFTFFVLFYLIKQLFSFNISLIALFIHTFSFFIISYDRSQGMINFIPSLSLIVFYCLYKVLNGNAKYLLGLALTIGFSFHIHFTAVFFPIVVFLSLPFFPWNKETVKYIFFAIPLFLVWLIPNIMSEMQSKSKNTGNIFSYIDKSYHGFHLRRVLQLTHDAFIEFHLILNKWVNGIHYLFLTLFGYLYFTNKPTRERFIICYLMMIWFLIPWLVFAVYSGEISNYYFTITRPLVLIILAYFTLKLLEIRNIIPKLAVIVFWAYFAYTNTQTFMQTEYSGLRDGTKRVEEALERGEKIPGGLMTQESYLYFYYTYLKNQ